MTLTLITWLSKYGYAGIIILIALENIFPPIPSEVILPFSGFLTTYTSLTVTGVIICATLGSTIGAIVLYWLGYLLTKEKMEKLLYGKVGKILHFNKDDVEYTMEWFNKKGKYTVFFCRCVPIVRSLISIPAGMSKMSWTPFLIMTVLGSLIWNTLLVNLGRLAGQSWNIAAHYIHNYSTVIKILLVSMLIVFIVYKAFKYHKKRHDKK